MIHMASNIDDVIRDDILRYMYELHRNARSPRSAGKGIRDVQKALKKRHGYKQQQVGSRRRLVTNVPLAWWNTRYES